MTIRDAILEAAEQTLGELLAPQPAHGMAERVTAAVMTQLADRLDGATLADIADIIRPTALAPRRTRRRNRADPLGAEPSPENRDDVAENLFETP